MSSVPDYEMPLSSDLNEGILKIAKQLTRRDRISLWALTAFLFAVGLAYDLSTGPDTHALVRIGNTITMLSFVHASTVLKWSRISEKVEKFCLDSFTEIEKDKIKDSTPPRDLEKVSAMRAHKRVNRVLPKMFQAVDKQILFHNLIVAALGTFLSGFGDMLK